MRHSFVFLRSAFLFALLGWLALGSLAVFSSTSLGSDETPRRKPNVVVILADDLGWSDTTLYGMTEFYRTPQIAKLADRGMTFTRAYSSSPLCSPTRASLLTGQSVARHGITAPQCHLGEVRLEAAETETAGKNQKSTTPQSATRLKTEHVTLAETLKAAGYATGHFGKWHLGREPYSPLEHGFDVDIPHWHGPGPAGSYVAPWRFPDFDHDPDIPDQHLEDRMAIEAVEFMREHADEPFFLNYWMFSVHAPFDAKADLIEAYRKRVDPKDTQRCPTYAAMIESMDDAVGTLVDELDRLGLSENTIIVFASDNGGNMYNEVEGERPTSNRPLRGGKATMYEGGVRGPAIVVWPGKVPLRSKSDQIIQTIDYYPTLLDLLDLQAPANQVMDGISIVPALEGRPLSRQAVFTYFPHAPGVPEWMPPAVSVHQGDWKLIRIFHGGEVVDGQRSHRWKLFNLANDVGEEKNVADQFPEKLAELDGLIEDHLRETGAKLPRENPDFDPSKYDPSREGIQAMSKSAKSNAAKPGPPVAGWRSARNVSLALEKDALVVNCTGHDPHFERKLAKVIPAGSVEVTMKISSGVSGDGQLFWAQQGVAPKYRYDRSVPFTVAEGDSVQEITVSFDASSPITHLRLDPLTDAGTVRLHSISVQSKGGKTLFQWRP
ncbi:MAG: sulfatase [Planctomycetota bacterium]